MKKPADEFKDVWDGLMAQRDVIRAAMEWSEKYTGNSEVKYSASIDRLRRACANLSAIRRSK